MAEGTRPTRGSDEWKKPERQPRAGGEPGSPAKQIVSRHARQRPVAYPPKVHTAPPQSISRARHIRKSTRTSPGIARAIPLTLGGCVSACAGLQSLLTRAIRHETTPSMDGTARLDPAHLRLRPVGRQLAEALRDEPPGRGGVDCRCLLPARRSGRQDRL